MHSTLTDERIKQIKKNVDLLFFRLENSNAFDHKEVIIKEFKLEKYLIDRNRYPDILFNLTQSDILKLQEDGIISNEYKINENTALPGFNNNPFAKLLYSILWKNGDLGKEHNIIKGVLSNKDSLPDSGIVFYQFGKYLSDHNEPIIDQHVIRCFLIKNEKDLSLIRKYISLEVIDYSYSMNIRKYKEWIKEIVRRKIYSTRDIDEILFAFGRYLKKQKEES